MDVFLYYLCCALPRFVGAAFPSPGREHSLTGKRRYPALSALFALEELTSRASLWSSVRHQNLLMLLQALTGTATAGGLPGDLRFTPQGTQLINLMSVLSTTFGSFRSGGDPSQIQPSRSREDPNNLPSSLFSNAFGGSVFYDSEVKEK
ncbi:hypothetical protein BDN72DRAFT_860076 [Pluteus cervinus]|uniref:Uncharacterized protein n=1 Tax=Pluteus cervinus TaxID=181527 RepID=A0ACD3ALQ3_9AGAR|nr:hypothetical protein BDN72DRAFT_860076 [Pluteus cervinus]